MRKSGLTGDEAYALSKRRGTTGDLGPLKKELGLLKEDISNKITKFYASNQGETHITDSDNGKIQDMMLYGKSSQDGTPSPENPVEIKSVVNPTIKICGKNLWNPILGGYISNIDGSISAASKKNSAVTDFIKTSGKDITVIARNFSSEMIASYAYRIGLYDARKKSIKNIIPSGGNKYSINTFGVAGVEYIRVSAPSGIYDTIQIEKGSEATPYEPYTEQSVQLPYTLNAIPVTSSGNVTIDGQQYVADYVDVERGKLIKMCKEKVFDGTEKWRSESSYMVADISNFSYVNNNNHEHMTYLLCNKYKVSTTIDNNDNLICIRKNGNGVVIKDTLHQSTVDDWKKYLNDNPCIVHCLSAISEEIDLTTEEIIAFKSLATCYPTTNISVNSEQLDGYTVFNYPISMQNGWNYVKQQLNDNRDYIYDMDLQSAEAYVNSEYAVALTELEV